MDSGGHLNIPSGGISDIERIEMQYPFIYFTRSHCQDGGGSALPGRRRQPSALMVYGSRDPSVDFSRTAAMPGLAFGLFGGYPTGYGGDARAVPRRADCWSGCARGDYPLSAAEVAARRGLGVPRPSPGRPAAPSDPRVLARSDYDFVQAAAATATRWTATPRAVARDLRIELICRARRRRRSTASSVDAQTARPTRRRRASGARRSAPSGCERAMRRQRDPGADAEQDWRPVLRFHEYLDLVRAADAFAIRCRQCRQVLCDGAANYKAHARRRTLDLEQFSGKRLPSGQDYRAVLHEYFCPGCATLLCVDVYCPELGADEPLWDTRFELAQFTAEAAR